MNRDNEMKGILDKERVIVYALGINWKKYKEQINKLFDIVACSDQNQEAAEYAVEYPFILPDQISKISYDKIIVGCKQRGVRELIALQYKIPGDKIFYCDEILGDIKFTPVNRNVKHNEKLTIAIPTYNRKERLRRTLDMLEMQSDDYFDIIISDNHSDYDVAETYADRSETFREKITLVCNKINMGMGLNYANLFVQKSGGWVWMLADDDIPSIYAVSDIYDEIDKAHDVGAIHFTIKDLSPYMIHDHKDFNSLHEMLEFYKVIMNQRCMDLSGDFIYLSNKVYNMKYIQNYYETIFTYAYSGLNYLAALLLMLNEGSAKLRISNKKIVAYDEPDGDHWNFLKSVTKARTITDICLDLNEEEMKLLYGLQTANYVSYLIDNVNRETALHDIRQIEKIYYEIYQYSFSDEEKRGYHERMAELKKIMLES